ncbi:MAG TPA: homoserine kinase [Persephonella sp.]|uniref:Homoserine kinase n=1 Tax=Persephonella marina (strain DSM 14350 / EX-H1) TaxID=123214 RepID=KHSE_PERMH|nr:MULTISPECIES: homoserine kinase [Persephonella]C0QQC5.1 RecName: Full=Homoserine kinase; Short=HK; Short=HSK [Persephonella marina EX-H1]ACO03812.1 homoserine kinase [Persephonella marina EX-H1]HCB69523.1 homoserine kinase [Persephonella sp.]
MKVLKVKVPATTANLGAGFDTLGLALTLYNEFIVEEHDGVVIETEPKNEFLEIPENNLFIQVIKYACERRGKTFHGAKLKQINRVPVARGLGSSATAIVGAIVVSSAVSKTELTDDIFFDIAYRFEPHPDNLIPAWKGGFITALKDREKTYYNSIDFPEDIKAVVVIPEFELSTEKARSVLPERIPLRDGIFNVQRVSLFLSALQNRRYDLLRVAMEDRFHQPYRKKLIPNFDRVVQNGYDAGALGVSLSGAGSAILALADRNFEEIGKAMTEGFSEAGIRSEYKILDIDREGANLEILE